MKNTYLKFLFFCAFFIFSNPVKAQNYNVSILPVRLTYNFDKHEFSDVRPRIELSLLYKYAEIERKISSKYSVNLGIAFSKFRYDFGPYGEFKSRSILIDPSIRYYINKKESMSGFYLGSGFNFINYSSSTKDYINDNTKAIANNYDSNVLNASFFGGYKLVVIHNRFSIDLKLNQQLNLLWQRNTRVYYDDGTQTNERNTSFFKTPEFSNLDLKLGYRFGFRK
ncbi:DUF3575 domain-containing protein [Pedobacter cryophilus]|uniref:DUF3575 domain-containing protein n=1 Tax=Pedobacter cryophilus TaxID=2571271 RepID=A0A4U1C200_9SPHI|nr:DUF3575 domain-containing protein [Pedobacter cryophilus]TKB99034.1 hypothetical protein FA046_07935 [Pedobacter cryophilus]